MDLALAATRDLIDAIQRLSLARTVEDIQGIVRTAARSLTGADGATFVLRDDEQCFYVDEDAISPLWKGQRFPLSDCVSGWAMLNREPAIIPDIYDDGRVPVEAYRPTFVRSLVMVPIRTIDPIGAIGNYWAQPHEPTADEVGLLGLLADSTAVALAHVALVEDLERRVESRTAALVEANERLEELSLSDELTGLRNRRGLFVLAGQELKTLARTHRPGLLLFVDVDGLKVVNDRDGHDAGDDLLRCVADGLRGATRSPDIVARLSGDEFAVFLPEATEPLEQIAERIRHSIAAGAPSDRRPSVSIGGASFDPAAPCDLDELLRRADAAMYEDKLARRAPAA